MIVPFESLSVGATRVDDTFAEAFGMHWTRLIVTAHDEHWLDAAVREVTGYASSVIACDAEAGLERTLRANETPDGRPGVSLLFFGFSPDAIGKAVANRVGQCVMTCPTTAVYNGLPEAETTRPLGKALRYFGDGYQKSKLLDRRRFWRVPTMDGEFVVEDRMGIEKGVGGGNLILQATDLTVALNAARQAVSAVAKLPGVIAPFPGGVARSGSKVGSRYKGLRASTAEVFCPTLRGRVECQLHPDATAALEIVLDGTSEPVVRGALRIALQAAAGPGIVAITAGNYGGRLGKYHFYLRDLLDTPSSEVSDA